MKYAELLKDRDALALGDELLEICQQVYDVYSLPAFADPIPRINNIAEEVVLKEMAAYDDTDPTQQKLSGMYARIGERLVNIWNEANESDYFFEGASESAQNIFFGFLERHHTAPIAVSQPKAACSIVACERRIGVQNPKQIGGFLMRDQASLKPVRFGIKSRLKLGNTTPDYMVSGGNDGYMPGALKVAIGS